MRTLISEVLLPASAAVGLLALLAIPPATAEERVPQAAPSTTFAAVAASSVPTHRIVPSSPATDRSAESSRPTIERRCERVERIGKFTITRCQ
jgi:hypothetical protein